MQNKLNFGIVMVFSLALLGLSACAPAVATKADKGSAKADTAKKSKKKAAVHGAFSCSMAGMQKTCFAVSPTPLKPKKGKLLIAGSGFKPKQKLGIRLVMGGVLSDISFMVKPRPVANKYGAFASTWKLKGRYFKMLKAGSVRTVWIVDQDGNTLATAPLVIDKKKKKKKKKM